MKLVNIHPPCLSKAIDIARQLVALRDPYTANHENCVGNFARAIAVELGLDQTIQEQLLLAGYLHDIGKIIVPMSILTKPRKLSPLGEEEAIAKRDALMVSEKIRNALAEAFIFETKCIRKKLYLSPGICKHRFVDFFGV